ncbi:hypothetical protein BGZ54_006240 [Gamsiella multidivaricata]|nr:hypothetical protein BGZ54_006240 [Gamsiella multidivaricata]
MLAGDRPLPSKTTSRNSFHGEPSPVSSHDHTRVKAKRLTHQPFTAQSPFGSAPPPSSQSQLQQTPVHSGHRPVSTASGARLSTSSESALAKEKEFMANTRILAMSNLIDSFTSASHHTKQGCYSKQLKIIGTASTSPSVTGAELDLTVKIHVIENTWTTCPLLPSSTILHRWKVTHLGTSSQADSGSVLEDIASDLEVVSLDEAHLNPDSDEDAQFWLEAQELMVGRDQFVGKLVASDGNKKTATLSESSTDESMQRQGDAAAKSRFEIAGCFTPSSSLHVSWISQGATDFVQSVEQELTVHIMGLPDQTKSSALLQHRKRKDPEDSHAIDHTDQEEDPVEYEHLEMDDGDLIITVDNTMAVNIQKLGWKQPFMDLTIHISDNLSGQSNDITLLDISGDAVQNWEAVEAIQSDNLGQSSALELDNLDKEPVADPGSHSPSIYRVWLFAGTEGMVDIHVSICVAQAVSVGYGKDITCLIPRFQVQGVSEDKGRIHVHTNNDLVVQRCIARNVESSPLDSHSPLDDGSSTRHQPVLHFHYQSFEYRLAVIAQRYQALARIARIERVRAEIGVSSQQQPGFARIVLSNIVLPQQDDPYLRVYQLDGAEVWSVLVNGKPCLKSIQFTDRKSAGQRTVLIPIEESVESESPHQVEISYGFNTLDREHEEDLDEEAVMSTIKLVVPGFSLPVGEYVVVANLPKLDEDMDYGEPSGDFEITSRVGLVGQRKTITYGAYMTLGRPKLSIKTVKGAVRTRVEQDQHTESTRMADQNSTTQLEQIGRSNVHASVVVHDPQQPPFNAGIATAQQASQRHPQQPLELQNPQAEQGLDGEILPILSARANGGAEGGAGVGPGQTSNLSPQVGSPALLQSGGRMAFSTREPFFLKTLSFAQMQHLVRMWWKQIMAPVAALALVIMIINVAAFQDTKSTSLDLVNIPAWRRPFAVIGRLWHDSSVTQRYLTSNGEFDGFMDDLIFSEKTVTVAEPGPVKTMPIEEDAPAIEATQELEALPRPDGGHEDQLSADDQEEDKGEEDGTRPESAGLMKLIETLKRIANGFKS